MTYCRSLLTKKGVYYAILQEKKAENISGENERKSKNGKIGEEKRV